MIMQQPSHDHTGRPRLRPAPPSAVPPDAALLSGVQAGDEDALASLYDRYGGLVFTLALRVVGDRDLAQEVLQDTFLRCWRGSATYRPERGGVAGWLMGIARNRAIDLLRSGQHQSRLREQQPLPAPYEEGHPRSADPTELVALRHTMSIALASLSSAQRQAVELAYYGGLTQAEIALSLGQPLGTVKTRIRDAMARLRSALQPPPGEEA